MRNKKIFSLSGEEEDFGWNLNWQITPKGYLSKEDGDLSVYKLSNKRNKLKKQAYMCGKCRNKGFIPINNYFSGSRAHHLTRDLVIFIPRKLHEKFNGKHYASKPETMVQINMEALKWLMRKDKWCGCDPLSKPVC